MNREEVIEKLIENEINTCKMLGKDSDDYISDIFRDGFMGYKNFTNKELIDEYLGQFNKKITIKKQIIEYINKG